MRGGGRKKKTNRNPCNSSEESSTGEVSTSDESDEGGAEDLWMKTIRMPRRMNEEVVREWNDEKVC